MIFELDRSQTVVQFWSDVRLPFEPKGEARRAREELRRALRGLAPTGELVAEFASADRGFCDVENVLLYNVGTAQFADLGSKRVRVVRSYGPVAAPSGRSLPYHHRYDTGPRSATRWNRRRLVGERSFGIPSPLRATTVWAKARAVVAPSELPSSSRELELDVDLTIPLGSTLGLASSMKALLDGVVASFHTHDGSGEGDLLATRIAEQLGTQTVAEVRELLRQGPAALGPRSLVRRFGDGVQWNPADDWLVAVDARMTREKAEQPRCTARLYEVAG